MDELERDKTGDPRGMVPSEFAVANWAAFIAKVEAIFGDPDPSGTARKEMRELKQADKETVEQFYHRFREVATRSASSEADLFMEFKSKIRPFIAVRVAGHTPEPDTLQTWAAKAIAIDKQLATSPANIALRNQRQGGGVGGTSQSNVSRVRFQSGQGGPRVSFTPPSTSSTYTQPPSISRGFPPSISQATRPSGPGPSVSSQSTARMRTITCWFCKQTGHISSQCPNRKTLNQMTHQEIHQMHTYFQDIEKQFYGYIDEVNEVVEEDPIEDSDNVVLDFQHEDE